MLLKISFFSWYFQFEGFLLEEKHTWKLQHVDMILKYCRVILREIKLSYFSKAEFRRSVNYDHNHKRWKNSLESYLDLVLFANELEFLKILVPRLSQDSWNVNIECVGKSTQRYFLYDQPPAAPIYCYFIDLILIFVFYFIMPGGNCTI